MIDLTDEDIDHLAYRRHRVQITDNRGAEKYHLPLEILQNYTARPLSLILIFELKYLRLQR